MFQPVVPLDGLAGWRFLQRTYPAQSEAFATSPQIQRDTDYFLDRIGSVTSAEDLVGDRRLLTVALGAFGLQDDINNAFFIRKVLEEGPASSDTLANRLSDSRYREIAEAFGFGPSGAVDRASPDFAAGIVSRFQLNSFEVAVGTETSALRVALYAERSLPDLAARDISNDAKWFTILGDPPMRQLFEKALNLPTSVGQIDIDQQLGIFKDRAQTTFGTDDISAFRDIATVQDVITKYVVRNQIADLNTTLSGTSIALTLLQT